MCDLFAVEEELLQKYVHYLETIPAGDVCPRAALQELTDGYARVLRQLRTLTKLSDKTTETLHSSKQLLIQKVRYDALTGVYSRHHMNEKLEEYAKTSQAGSLFCFMMVDVDYFKNYNDTYGHPVGDTCLKTVASALSESIFGMNGFVARYGGEEFAVVLPNTDDATVWATADRLLRAVADKRIPHENSSIADHVTVSIGCVTSILHEGYQLAHFIETADQALYQSKLSGRNQVTRVKLKEADL